jgi:hypothetical protein
MTWRSLLDRAIAEPDEAQRLTLLKQAPALFRDSIPAPQPSRPGRDVAPHPA